MTVNNSLDYQGMIAKAKPLFLIGVPRSGTTFFSGVLNAHPELLQTNETAVFFQLGHLVNNSKLGAKSGLLYGKQYPALWSDHLKNASRMLLEHFYADIARDQKRTHVEYWGDKHPHHADVLPFLDQIFPDARYIYLVRNPHAVASSIMKMNAWEPWRAYKIVEKLAKGYEDFLANHGDDKILTLQYEDMIANVETEVEAVLRWLGLDDSDILRQFIKENKNVNPHSKLHRRLVKSRFKRLYFMKKFKANISPKAHKGVSFSDWMRKYFKKYNYSL